MNKRNYTLKVNKNGQVVESINTHSIRRFLPRTRTLSWEDDTPRIFLRVSYGDGFYNDGDYENKKDFKVALEAFLE